MITLIKTEAYVCPNATLETSPERAVAHHLELLMSDGGHAPNFNTALWMVENRASIIEVLTMMDREPRSPDSEVESN